MAAKVRVLLFIVLALSFLPTPARSAQSTGLPVDVPRTEVFVADQILRYTNVDDFNMWISGPIQPTRHGLLMDTLWITHDMGVHANLADRIAVLYAGTVVEEGETRTVLKHPCHPYTQHLIRSLPQLDERSERVSIPGRPPALDNPPSGCRFHPRCPLAVDKCSTVVPESIEIESGHRVACHVVTEGLRRVPTA